MADLRPAAERLERQPSKLENSLWIRLRESIDRLRTVDQQTTADALAQKLAGRARLLRGSLAVAESGPAPLVFLALNKGRERYGISVEHVLEVQALDHFTVVPRTPLFLPGVVHWRGAILSLLDLGRLLGAPETGLADIHVYVVVEAAGRRVGIVAQEVEDVYTVARGCIASAPPLSAGVPPDWILGVHDNQRLLLDLELVLQSPQLADWMTNQNHTSLGGFQNQFGDLKP